MKKVYLALFSLFIVFGLSVNSQAAEFTLDGDYGTVPYEPLAVPGAYAVGADMDVIGGSIVDYWMFTVASEASYGSLVGSIGLNGTGFSSFSTSLQMDNDGWITIATGTTFGIGTTWSSILNFSPLSPSPTEYRLVVSGTQVPGPASYGGNISLSPVTPVPEPEIYAMMAAGLGLMGFVARRRQRNAA